MTIVKGDLCEKAAGLDYVTGVFRVWENADLLSTYSPKYARAWPRLSSSYHDHDHGDDEPQGSPPSTFVALRPALLKLTKATLLVHTLRAQRPHLRRPKI